MSGFTLLPLQTACRLSLLQAAMSACACLQMSVLAGAADWTEHHIMMRILKAFLRAPKNLARFESNRNALTHALDFFLKTLHPLRSRRITAEAALHHRVLSRPADQADSLADLAASLLKM